jgi:mannan endo-1,4-beta-mannosidase
MRRLHLPGKIAALVLGVLAVTATPAPAGNVGFVRAQNAQFVLDGQRFDFVGTVAFALLAGKIYGIESFTHDVIAAARANNFRVVRTWGYFLGRPESIEPAPRQYNESALQALDWVIKQFDDAGIRLVVPLFGRYDNFGGMLTYAQWVGRGPDLVAFYTDPNAKALYKDYVRMLLNRTNVYTGRQYKNEPTILAWELADEPNLPDVDRSGNIFHAWASEMAAFVKSVDSNHLLGTGEEGYDTSLAGYSDVASVYNGNFWLLDGNKGMSYTRNTAIPHIDYGTFKFYPELWLMPGKAASGAAWIRDHVRIARALGKPVVFSEFGDSATWHADDPAVLDAWLTALDQEGGGGAQFWQLVAPGWWCDQFCVTHPPSTRISQALRAAAVRANSRSGGGPSQPSSATRSTMARGLVGGPGSAVNVAVRGTDNGIYHARFDGSQWSTWGSPGGSTADAPAMVANGAMLDLVVRGTDNGIYHNRSDGANWWGWTKLPGATPDAPALVANGAMLELVVRGTDNGIYHNRFNGSWWSGWTSLGGTTPDGPALVARNGGLDLVVRGIDSGIYHNRFDGSRWSGWTALGGATLDSPTLVTRSGGLDVVIRGTNSGIYHNRFDGTRWLGWTTPGGTTLDSPALAAYGSGLELTIRGTNNGIYHNRFDGTRWLGWVTLGGATQDSPALVSHGAGVELLIRGTNNGIYHNRFDGARWSGWFVGGQN